MDPLIMPQPSILSMIEQLWSSAPWDALLGLSAVCHPMEHNHCVFLIMCSLFIPGELLSFLEECRVHCIYILKRTEKMGEGRTGECYHKSADYMILFSAEFSSLGPTIEDIFRFPWFKTNKKPGCIYVWSSTYSRAEIRCLSCIFSFHGLC